ncbi:MAG TPA: glutamine--fructose-6-phosphate transaminase (isomerizing) [Firmicutes bacterium]|jgi:glucosamine--fructose-6-phosphate aminotransferase (isomerizing)|nr:glutamine--fructose-6-phosphate transaminase (isomerizing) [Bacillota bacterium]HAW69621.1 glutamine--fructose-6-phosphate transaminase (isomerizing) [Bacillota bacterium]HAZ23159.1 glutamine--fructose-6-phosphate transaminase (isomerizing) [Bacillota bacterium]HBE05778.1 glutamine--fructose-6-phosphate transaminase (isomerizing) [Bacillota bacterium]HBL48724.1 glutamine--fructose-6-phosphate transaminase (isomerizing) [Bacillota bacterium]
MCGIVGYVGNAQAYPILIEGLRSLEYRGYDSAGVAIHQGNRLVIHKQAGRLNELAQALAQEDVSGTTAIGHTRWATHGKPSDRNAHPHSDCTGQIVAVHNGIIENYLALKEWLQEQGHIFNSETDTEVIPHLIEHFYHGDLLEAMRDVTRRLKGSYALAVLHRDHPDEIVAVRKDSPLVVGLADGQNFLASDIPAILEHTRAVYILNDGELVLLTAQNVKVFDEQGCEKVKEVFKVDWDPIMAQKNGYEDFMLKEIHEQPSAIRRTLGDHITADGRIKLDEVRLTPAAIKSLAKINVVACGTAYHAGLVGKSLLEKLVRIPVEADLASEFRYKDPVIGPDTLTIVISQSGETADTLAALRESRKLGSRVLAITNVVGSSVAREADDVIMTLAGPEIAVASTKAYMTQLVALYILTLFLAQERGTLAKERIRFLAEELRQLPETVEKALTTEPRIKELARDFQQCEDIFFIGRGLDFAVSLEGALKLKEISYIHAEAYAAGELKHGTLALIVKGVPVFALATQPELYEKMLSNIKEVKAREATVVAVVPTGDHGTAKSVDFVMHIPKTDPLLEPVLAVVPLQLFAYYAAKTRGCDVDKPRNLAKSVTVE